MNVFVVPLSVSYDRSSKQRFPSPYHRLAHDWEARHRITLLTYGLYMSVPVCMLSSAQLSWMTVAAAAATAVALPITV